MQRRFEDKVVLVTGSSSGLGYENARVLANKNAKVIIAVRNQQKETRQLNKLKRKTATPMFR